MSAEISAVKGIFARFFPDACVVLASGTCAAAALGLIQGLFGAIGAILGVVYLYYRIKNVRQE